MSKTFEEQALEGITSLGSKIDTQAAEVKAVRSQQDELVQNYDQLDKNTKKAFEDLTALKKTANDSNASFQAFELKIKEIQQRLRWEQRAAFGDPVKRIQADEELRTRFNAAIRMAVDKNGDMVRTTADMVKRALGEDSSPGSTLINDALQREIYDTLSMYGIWNTFAVRQTGTKTTKFPVKTVRPVAGFILSEGSGQIADDTNKAGTSVDCVMEVIAVLLNVSVQLLEDSEFDVTADILDDFAEAFAYRMDWACLQADGGADSTDGGMTGIFGGGATAAAAASGNTTVETTDFEDWTKCLLTVDPIVLNRNARWWMHPQVLVRALSVKDLNGRPIFLTATEAPTKGGIGSILGYPTVPAFAAPTANTTSSKVAVFGDPNGLVVGVRKGFTFEASDHHKWDYLQRSFRGYGRVGTKIRRALSFACLTLASG
jgi:HK97 family phage major capsid protein